jgi:hypothetical protein
MSIKRMFLVLSLVLILVTANFVYAEGNTDNSEEGIITPQYVMYCPENADGMGRHWDIDSQAVKVKFDGVGETYISALWQCRECGERIVNVDALGHVYFDPESDATQVTVGLPPIQWWYYDVERYDEGPRDDWKFGW